MTEFNAETLRNILDYDKETGIFRTRKTGRVVGHVNPKYGYVYIDVLGKSYTAGRLAWLHVTGEWPDRLVDHISTVRHENWWTNLRLATYSENQSNRGPQKNNKSGLKGVSWYPETKRWRARIKAHGKLISLGTHNTPEEAHAAYMQAARKHYGEFARAA